MASACGESNPEKKKALLSAVESIISQAHDLTRQMEIEMRSAESSEARKGLGERIDHYKGIVADLRRDFKETKREDESASLMENSTQGHRDRLLSANAVLERSSDRIRRALEITSETEATALEITEELGEWYILLINEEETQ